MKNLSTDQTFNRFFVFESIVRPQVLHCPFDQVFLVGAHVVLVILRLYFMHDLLYHVSQLYVGVDRQVVSGKSHPHFLFDGCP